LLLSILQGFAFAQEPADAHELQAFFYPIFTEQMEKHHIPGAMFVMVKDGQTVFMKGYGYADLASKRPVDPEKTLFRVASVSKLFNTTAVMQLYEQGLIRLDDDVNKYLKLFKLEENFSQPVTVAHLLTHTGGFDERAIGMDARTQTEMLPLGEYLARRMPPRVMPPGEQYSYSNHGMALAGYLVEVISGVPFEQYIDENILRPLGMNHSSFEEPPPFAEDLAVGYVYKKGRYEVVPYDCSNVGPAGAFQTTAADMARFMIAHLQDGRFGDARILLEETARGMHKQQFAHDPRLPGAAYGFYESFENDQRALMHGGDLRGFASLMYLLPDHNLGFFVSCNNNVGTSFSEGPGLREELTSRFLDHYFPADVEPISRKSQPDLVRSPDRFAGSYRHNRYARRTIEKLTALFSQFRVWANHDGTLTIYYPGNYKKPARWVEVEPLLFRQVDGEELAVFREDASGRITHLLIDTAPLQFSEKLPWYETTIFHVAFIAVLVLIFLSACVLWTVNYFAHRLRRRSSTGSAMPRIALLAAGVVSLLNVVCLAGLALALRSEIYEFVYGVPPIILALLCIPPLTTVLTVALLLFTVLVWKNGWWTLAGRVHYSLVTLAAVSFIPFLIYWNLLGFRF